METTHKFEEYIEYLKDSLINLVQYREKTGTLDLGVLQVKEDLFHEDPFIVFSASIAASLLLSDRSIYH